MTRIACVLLACGLLLLAVGLACDLGSVLGVGSAWQWSAGLGFSRFESTRGGTSTDSQSLEFASTVGYAPAAAGGRFAVLASLAALNLTSVDRRLDSSDLLLPARWRGGVSLSSTYDVVEFGIAAGF